MTQPPIDELAATEGRDKLDESATRTIEDAAEALYKSHRTIDRVTTIVEQVVYNPGITFTELVKSVGAAKSSVHGFVQGLLSAGWLYEENQRYYLGATIYGLTVASGGTSEGTHVGSVTNQDLQQLHDRTGIAVLFGIPVGEHLIYVAEVGNDPATMFYARSNIRRRLLDTAGGKAILSEYSSNALNRYLRRHVEEEREQVHEFLQQVPAIRKSRIATNYTQRKSRYALASTVKTSAGETIGALILVGNTEEVLPREVELGRILLEEVERLEAHAGLGRSRTPNATT